MRIKPNFKLREIAGENILVNQGTTGTNMTRIISLNSSARLLYEHLYDKDFTLEDVAEYLSATYGISDERALHDAEQWVSSLKKCAVIE